MGVRLKLEGVAAASDYLTKIMSEQQGGPNGAASRCSGQTAVSFPARRSKVMASMALGLRS